MKRRTFLSLSAPAALAICGIDLFTQGSPAFAASTYPLPVGTATAFNTIREPDILNRPTEFNFIGRQVRSLTIQSRNRGEPATVQDRDSFGFRSKWQVMNPVDILVVAEVGTFAQAKAVAQRHLDAISRIPFRFRKEISKITIVDGIGTFRGGRGNVHSFADRHPQFNAFQGTMFHEILHSVDHAMSDSLRTRWKAAQQADRRDAPRFDGFISSYARDNPDREDFPSAVVPWYSLRKHPDRLTAEQRLFVREQIPNRMRFLDANYSV